MTDPCGCHYVVAGKSPEIRALVERARNRALSIRESGLSIYGEMDASESDLFYPDSELEAYLETVLGGVELGGPPRSRAKLAKQLVAEALGYQPPSSFKKTRPRFPSQDLDVYVQKADNLQIWNEDTSPERRYVLIRPDEHDVVRRVRVIRGQQLAEWDRTGTLTSKYQAKRIAGRGGSCLVSDSDTDLFASVLSPAQLGANALGQASSADSPVPGLVMPISQLYETLVGLVGIRLRPTGSDQDRVRGELLQHHASRVLGIGEYVNAGHWPDLACQALEVKLQTAPTIDLGLVLPTSTSHARALGPGLRHCDARYLVAYGRALSSGGVEITDIVVATGADFFAEFVQFAGLVESRKRQIPLPRDLFQSNQFPDQGVERL